MRVPPIVELRRSWLPPVRKMPVASRRACAVASSLASARVTVWMGRTWWQPSSPKTRWYSSPAAAPSDEAVLMTVRRAVVAAGQLDEAAQDDPLADLVLGAADDHDVTLGHRPSIPALQGPSDCYHPCGTAMTATTTPSAPSGPGRTASPHPDRRQAGGPCAPPAAFRPRPVAAAPRAPPAPGDHPARRGRGGGRRLAGLPRRPGRRGRPGLLGRRAHVAGRRRPVPPDRPVPALRLRPVAAAALRALGAPPVERGVVRVERPQRAALPVDGRMGLPAPSARHGPHRVAAAPAAHRHASTRAT